MSSEAGASVIFRKDTLVYIAGPMTAKHGRSIEDNAAVGVNVYFELITLGIPAFCPHLGGLAPTAWTIDHATWLAYDFAIIDRCTDVLMLPNWEESVGAVKEYQYASLQQKRVHYSVCAIVAALSLRV